MGQGGEYVSIPSGVQHGDGGAKFPRPHCAAVRPATRSPRRDKWYLGSGDGLLWAPPFPLWLEVPGCWDDAHLFQYAVGTPFTVSLVAGGRPLPSRCLSRRWEPAVLTLEHRFGPLAARETRAVDGRALVAELSFRGRIAAGPVDLVVWTALDPEALAGSVTAPPDGVTFRRSAPRRFTPRAAAGAVVLRSCRRFAPLPVVRPSTPLRSSRSQGARLP